jgi:hypothetical protein
MLGQDLGLETAVAVARNGDFDFSELTLDGFPALAVAAIAAAASFRLMFAIAEMIGQLSTHSPCLTRSSAFLTS